MVLSVAGFTVRQILFLALLYAPHLAGILAVVAFGEIGAFFLGAELWKFVAAGALLYIAGLALPFANLLWALTIKRCLIGTAFRGEAAFGAYPKWSRMHLRVWCVGRLQGAVLGPLDGPTSLIDDEPSLHQHRLHCCHKRLTMTQASNWPAPCSSSVSQ